MLEIGKSPPRPDGPAKVSGAARYLDDVVLPGMWHGATVRSPHPHARVRAVRFDPDKAPEGTVCVTAADLPGPNGVQLLDDSWPILASEVVCHVGEPVALVAAPTRLAARQALATVTVDYEPLPAIVGIDEAEAHPSICEKALVSGDVDAAFAHADRVVSGEYRTGYQEHIYIECQGAVARFEDDGTLSVLSSTQCPYYVHKALVHGFKLPPEKVRVRATAVGGGFGGKEDFPSLLALHAGLLSRACGKPVKMVYDRQEDIIATTKRHPGLVRHRTAVQKDGRILGMEIEVLFDGGAYATLSLVVLSRALLHSFGPYRVADVRIRGRVLRTHTAPNSAFRGFGAPQVELAAERHIDRIARELGLDPYEIRDRNAVVAGDALPTGQVLDESTSARLCLEEAERRTGFRKRWHELEAARAARRDGEPLRGIGLSLYFHGAGFTGNGERRMNSPVTARLLDDGRIEVLTAMVDMGQGCAAVFPQIAAEAAGVGLEDVCFAEPDTHLVPDSGPTVASRTTMVVGGLIARVAAGLRDRVLVWHRGRGEADLPFREMAARFVRAGGEAELTLRYESPAGHSYDEETCLGEAYPTYGWGADVVEVEVDPDTFAVRPLRVTAVCEVGRALHPTLCAGQIEGGTLQALGWALWEEIKLKDGHYLNDRLATYIIPTIEDTPPIDTVLLERPWNGGPFGAKGVGELPMDGAAPAVLQAIENATGIRATEIPATPERLLAWRQAGQTVAFREEPR